VGASTIVYPPDGTALYLFPRSVTPEAEWLADNLPGATHLEPIIASDGAPAFTGYRLGSSIDLPDEALADFSGVVRLVQYQANRAISGDTLDMTIVWHILSSSPYPGLTPFYHLEDPWGFRWGQAEPFHYAADDWTPGETVVDRVQIPVTVGAPPGDYVVKSGLYSQDADRRLPIVDNADRFAGTTIPLSVTLARAEATPDPAVLEIRNGLALEVNDGLTLLGFNLDTAQARPGERIYLTLFWQTSERLTVRPSSERADYSVELSLQSTAQDDITLYYGAPIHDTYPISDWTDNEVVVDRYSPRLPLATAVAPPGDYSLMLTLSSSDGKTIHGPMTLGTVTLVATDRTFDVPVMQHAQNVILGEKVELLGYDIDLDDARPAGTIHLALYWRVLSEMSVNYSVFTHVLNTVGQIVAQQDNPPVNGTYATSLWLPGEIVTDPYSISLPTGLQPGDYPIQVGFYIPENGLRLADPVLLDTAVTIQP
jgi:hypothetical protein